MPTRNRIPGRGWAYVGVILGGLVSIAANVAHTFIPPITAPAGWQPETMAIGFAVCWPVFLFVAVEILARTPWPRRGGYALTRWVGLLPVAMVAAFVSYRHLSGLLAHYGEEPLVTVLGPLAVDGLMVMATAAIMATSPRRNPTPAPAAVPIPAAAAAAATSTPARKAPARKAVKAPGTPAKTTPTKATPARKTSTPAPIPVPTSHNPGELATQISAPRHDTVPAAPAQATAVATKTTPVAIVAAAPPPATPVPASLLTKAEHVIRAHIEHTGTPITPGELAVRMRVNTDVATQVLAVLALRPDNPNQPAPTINGTPLAEATR